MKKYIQYVLEYKVPDKQVENVQVRHFSDERKLMEAYLRARDNDEYTNVVAKKRVITQTDWEYLDYED